jgi:hypothetical protein
MARKGRRAKTDLIRQHDRSAHDMEHADLGLRSGSVFFVDDALSARFIDVLRPFFRGKLDGFSGFYANCELCLQYRPQMQ